ncbi:hypothetical protein Tco_0854582, partial [Tanacetum coccineum]
VVVSEGSEQPPEPQPIPSTAPLEVLSQVTTSATSQPPKDPNTYRRTNKGQNTKIPQSGGSLNKVGDEAINEEMFDSVERTTTTASSLEAEQARGGHTLGSGEDSMEHQIELTDNVPNTPHDSPLPGVNTPRSDEGSLELNELMDLVTKLSHMVFDLEKVKTAQAKEIAGLKRSVTKLEQRQRSKILKNHPFRFSSSRRQSLGMAIVQEKDAENQGKIGADDTEVVKGSVFDDEDVTMAMAQTLIKMKEEKAKEKGVVIKDVEDSPRLETESVEKTKKKVQGDAQMERDAEVALRLQAKLDEELIVERERQEKASKVAIAKMFDELLGKMEEKDMYVYKLTRADGSSSCDGDTQAFLRRLDRMIFDLDEKDELWMNQLDWKLLRWKLYESCGVHTLFMDGTLMEINMLVEKKYPLIKELLEKMLNL